MNRIESLAQQVESLFKELDDDIARFSAWSGIHCAFGCGKCCLKPDIEASPLEFLPFALEVYRRGEVPKWLEKIKQSGTTCVVFDENQPGAGKCSEYSYRGMICRLFGYSARRNKYNRREMITCSVIKAEQSISFQQAEEKINEGGEIPVAADYYSRLRGIDPGLGGQLFPINEAIRAALEAVDAIFYYESGHTTV